MELSKVQDLIQSNNGHQNYQIYRQHELSYWEHVKSWIDDSPIGINILDIGCAYGTLGLYTKLLSDGNLYCLDFVKYMSDELIDKFGINYKVLNFEKDSLPWVVKFDVIIFTEILEHLNGSPVDALNKIYSLLNDDGVLYISTPNSKLWGKLTNYSTWKDIPNINEINTIKDAHIYQYNIEELTDLLFLCGFEIELCKESVVANGLTNLNLKVKKRLAKLTNVNTKDYWDNRFDSGSWQDNNGFKQTTYFAEAIFNSLSNEVKDGLKDSSVLDYACACGQLCGVFKDKIDGIKMTGYDFSEKAIQIAKDLNVGCEFVSEEPKETFDAVILSHVLEHMEDGIGFLTEKSMFANRYLIVSTPHKEDADNLVKEHIVSIGDDYFPETIGEFCKIESVVVDTRDSGYWHGDVIVVVYKRVEKKVARRKK